MIRRPVASDSPRPVFVPVESAPKYLPHIKQPETLALGLQSVTADWLDPCSNLPAWRDYKVAQRRQLGDDVYRVLPEALPACAEFARLINSAAGAASPSDFDGSANSRAPVDDPSELLWQASLNVPEDLVVMLPSSSGYCIAAASLCSPSHWRLREKIGLPIARVHDPIPQIHQTLTPQIDRFFDRLRHLKPIQRFNWSLQEDAQYFAWPSHEAAPFDADTPLFYRVERQTLRRLPQSNAVAFTIRVFLAPLESLASTPGALSALLAAIEVTPADIAGYKNFPRFARALDKYRAMANQLS